MINIHCCYIILHCTKDPLNILKIIDCWLFMLWDTSPLKILNVSHEIHNISHEIPNILMISLLCRMADRWSRGRLRGARGGGCLGGAGSGHLRLGVPWRSGPPAMGVCQPAMGVPQENQPWGYPKSWLVSMGASQNGWFIRGNPIQKWMMTGGIMTQETTIDDATRCHWLNNAMELGFKYVYKDVYSTQKWFQ